MLSIKGANKVVNLLRELKAYKQMWLKLSEVYGNYFSTFDVRKANDIEYKYLDELMNIIKQKYLPKEAKQDYSEGNK